jgi:hypothetical protein
MLVPAGLTGGFCGAYGRSFGNVDKMLTNSGKNTVLGRDYFFLKAILAKQEAVLLIRCIISN